METETTKHTPLPWVIHRHDPAAILGQDRKVVTLTTTLRPIEEDHTNAEYIVRACNSHYDLLEACKTAREALILTSMTDKSSTSEDALSAVELAIAKAEGNTE